MILAAVLLFASADSATQESAFVASFTEVCLGNLGDLADQATAAAKSASNFSRTSKVVDGMDEYISEVGRLGIGGPHKACALTSRLPSATTLQSVVKTMSATIGTDGGEQLDDADSRYWLISGTSAEEYVLSVKVSRAENSPLATLWVQPRATLNATNSKAN
jgi:hypothetical protein